MQVRKKGDGIPLSKDERNSGHRDRYRDIAVGQKEKEKRRDMTLDKRGELARKRRSKE